MTTNILEYFSSKEFYDLVKSPQIIALFITTLLGLLARIFQPRASVLWGTSHGFTFSVPQNTGNIMLIHTGTIFVRNWGRVPAKQIEFYFNYKPEHFQIWPVVEHTTMTVANNQFVLKFPFLKQGEQFSIELLQAGSPTPDVINVRAMEGNCKKVVMAAFRVFSNKVYATIWVVIAVGIYQLIAWAVHFLQLL